MSGFHVSDLIPSAQACVVQLEGGSVQVRKMLL